ncbi:MAG: ABC transporter ATP-binding protein [Dehalococcoidia bacterium]|nr:ABC transporter ATP-binding protein [Dehalococcoidia bacterium]
MDLVGFADRRISDLSGGEQQRVALARALVPQPNILLLDEPFSNLDPVLRASLREQVRGIVRSAGVTTLMVTHDQEEALSMADRIGFMKDGHIRQIGVAEELFTQPSDVSVAEFFGDSNILQYNTSAPRTLNWPLGTISVPDGVSAVSLVISPDSVEIMPHGVDGVVLDLQYFGYYRKISVELSDGQHIHVRQSGLNYLPTNIGERVGLVLLRAPTVFSVD